MNFERKTGGLPKPHPGGFGKPTDLPPVFTGFVNLDYSTTEKKQKIQSNQLK